MTISFKQVNQPTITAMTVAEAEQHLRIVSADAAEIAYITGLIRTAERYCESYCRRKFVATDFIGYMDAFPLSGNMIINKSPIISLSTIKYYDSDNVLQTLDPKYYDFDIVSEPARISFIYPPSAYDRMNAIQIAFKAGYSSDGTTYDPALLPQAIKSAMSLIIGHLYEHREEVVVGVSQAEIDFGVDRLLDTERIFMF